MELHNTPLSGLYLLESPKFKDDRGSFQKVFNKDFFAHNKLESDFHELYYSVNNKNVIRGMHFQLPPADHTKLVYVSRGSILDVVIDIRKASPTYGKAYSVILSEDEDKYLYIPRGFAHGFLSLADGSIVNYAQTSVYSPTHDCGILATACGVSWPVDNPIFSQRDMNFESLGQFKSPF